MSFDLAFIGYQNRLTDATISAVGVSSGFSANSLKNWQAWDYVQFNSGSNSVTIDCGSSVDVDYFAIAAHELFTTNTDNIVLIGSNDPSFTTSSTLATLNNVSAGVYDGSYAFNTSTAIPTQSVDDDYVIALKLDSVNFRYYRLSFVNSAAIKIGVIALGERLEFELGFYRDNMPPLLNEDTIVTNNKSESGIFLGRSIVRVGVKQMTISVDNHTHSWIYNQWLPFKRSAEVNPFIYSWGNTPFYNNQLCYQTKFNDIKLQDRIGSGHGSVGVSFEGVIK